MFIFFYSFCPSYFLFNTMWRVFHKRLYSRRLHLVARPVIITKGAKGKRSRRLESRKGDGNCPREEEYRLAMRRAASRAPCTLHVRRARFTCAVHASRAPCTYTLHVRRARFTCAVHASRAPCTLHVRRARFTCAVHASRAPCTLHVRRARWS